MCVYRSKQQQNTKHIPKQWTTAMEKSIIKNSLIKFTKKECEEEEEAAKQHRNVEIIAIVSKPLSLVLNLIIIMLLRYRRRRRCRRNQLTMFGFSLSIVFGEMLFRPFYRKRRWASAGENFHQFGGYQWKWSLHYTLKPHTMLSRPATMAVWS